MVEVNVTLGSQLIERIERSGNFIQGELINIPVTGLQPGTEYTFTSRAVNELGTGDISTEFQFTTSKRRREKSISKLSANYCGITNKTSYLDDMQSHYRYFALLLLSSP